MKNTALLLAKVEESTLNTKKGQEEEEEEECRSQIAEPHIHSRMW